MKKLLMGTMAAAMAVTAFATEENLGNKVAKLPVTANITVGEMTTEASISVKGDLNFGDLKPSMEVGGNQASTAPRKVLVVSKVVGQESTVLPAGQYQYKVSKENRTWAQDGEWAKTTGVDEHSAVFKLNGTGELVSIGDTTYGHPYGVRAEAMEDGLNVYISGDISSSATHGVYTVGANVYVALLDA